MRIPKGAVVAVGVAGLLGSAAWLATPPLTDRAIDPQEVRQERIGQQVEELADSQEKSEGRKRDEANDLVNDNNKEQLRPTEPRPGVRPNLPGPWW
ncbi:hypothetical protein QYM41_16335 [Kocuria sp. CPCC 205268]|uniref:hypothetical protein n=1 Tax=Kocuria oxytropis TaxID=3058913 RepID=UPI0034D5BE6B